MKLTFEWHAAKAEANHKKHNVSFEEAKTIFGDPFLLTFPDEEHSHIEERFINIGRTPKGRVLIVIHTEREGSIRIISSRKATAFERNIYEEGGF